MNKEILGTDREKEQRLRTSTNFASFVLNSVVFPIAKELDMNLDLRDSDKLSRYIKNLDSMRADYVATAINGVENPTLKKVVVTETERQWAEIASKHPLPNPGILLDIVDDALNYVAIMGKSISEAQATANNRAIQEACVIYATEEDAKKKADLESLCETMNGVFNGAGDFFSQYILLVNGTFIPNPKATNYKPLIYGK